jgi:hypothetical protein
MAILPTDFRILFTNYDIIRYLLNLASYSEHCLRVWFGCHRVTFCWHRTCFHCSLAVDQVRGHLRAKFKIPYSYGHLVSMTTIITKASNQKFREFQKNNQTVPEKIRKKITESEIVYNKNCHWYFRLCSFLVLLCGLRVSCGYRLL